MCGSPGKTDNTSSTPPVGARRNRIRYPPLSVPNRATGAGLPGIRQALAATRHLLEMYRRGLSDDSARRRLLDTAIQLDRITTAEK